MCGVSSIFGRIHMRWIQKAAGYSPNLMVVDNFLKPVKAWIEPVSEYTITVQPRSVSLQESGWWISSPRLTQDPFPFLGWTKIPWNRINFQYLHDPLPLWMTYPCSLWWPLDTVDPPLFLVPFRTKLKTHIMARDFPVIPSLSIWNNHIIPSFPVKSHYISIINHY